MSVRGRLPGVILLIAVLIAAAARAEVKEADVVFERIGGDVYLLSADGTTETKLAHHARSPVCTPDGREIVFVAPGDRAQSTYEIHAVRRDGSERRIVVSQSHRPSGGRFALSPDGTRVAFAGRDGQVHVARLDRVEVRRVTDGLDQVADLAWSPRGDRLVFFARRAAPRGIVLDPSANLTGHEPGAYFILAPATLEIRRLSIPAAERHAPAWAPDGRRLAITGFGDVRIVDVDAVTSTTIQNAPPLAHEVAWSPDGQWLALSATDKGDPLLVDRHVYVTASDGTAIRRVSRPRWRLGLHSGPRWHPTAPRLLFTSQYPRGDMELWPFGKYEYPNVFVAELPSLDVRRLSRSPDRSDDFAEWCPRP
jgi:Tol biopolymer transport system component